MRRRISTGLVGFFAVLAAALSLGSGGAWAKPFIIKFPGHFAEQPTAAQCEAGYNTECYTAAQIRHAYGVDQLNAQGLTGTGETIVLVDSYGSPTIQNDLQVFDQANHLPAPPSFALLAPAGAPPAWNPTLYPDQSGWAGEATLDVEMAHAMAPGANLILVETPVDETEGVVGLPQMMDAEQYVIDHHLGSVISQSFGATEQTFQNAKGQFDPALIYGLRYAYEDAAAKGVTVLAATGDDGAADYELDATDLYPFPVVDWPDSDPLVTAVGGTELSLDEFGNRTAPDAVWNDPRGQVFRRIPVCEQRRPINRILETVLPKRCAERGRWRPRSARCGDERVVQWRGGHVRNLPAAALIRGRLGADVRHERGHTAVRG